MPDAYTSFLNAQAVAVAWIGAVFGPIFVLIGYLENSMAHLLVGAVMLAISLWSVWIGFKMLEIGAPRSDIAVHLVVPSILLVGGVTLAAYFSS